MLEHVRRGAGEPLLLVHGLGATRHVWDPVIEPLSAEREVVAVDMPGFGSSPPLPAGTEPTAANLAAALVDFCAEAGLGTPHVAGNSLGGWVALEMGRAGAAASVTALSPAGLWRGAIGTNGFDAHGWARRLRPAVAAALWAGPARRAALRTFVARPEAIPAGPGRRIVLDWVDSPSYEAANRAMREESFDPSGYPEIPVTLAWCELDRLVRPPRPERRPASARYLVLEGVGHTPTWDDPGLVAATLLESSALPARS